MWRQFVRLKFGNSAFLAPRRHLSSKCIDHSIRDLTAAVTSKQPVFQIPPTSVRILTRPSDFYNKLLDMIEHAEERIFLSSLYIGAEETELISAIERRLREKPDLHITLLLDLNRSTRPGADSTARILLPLLREFPSRVHVSLFRSPSLRGFLAKLVPARFNEGWGTWHAKIYGADDNVIISGANLNKSYFTNRQDRYVCFSHQKAFSQYCFDFMQATTKFSYRLLPISLDLTSTSSLGPYSYTCEDYTLHWPMPNIHPHHFNPIATAAFSDLQKSYRERSSQLPGCANQTSHALLVPIIQAGQFSIREEESLFRQLFLHLGRIPLSKNPRLDLTSGYFSLYRPYQDLILNTPNIDCRIVAASPKANGFYRSKGVSGRIPEGYTLYEQRFMKAVAKAGRLWRGPSERGVAQGVQLSEWEKTGWTYHAKGIWLSPSSSTPPVLTLFGSTNLNSRSAHIDTELSFLMIVPSDTQSTSAVSSGSGSAEPSPGSALLSLRQDLASEIDRIAADTNKWKGDSRKVRWTTKVIVWLVKGML